jgi:NAD(P)-dependent dehydrogenase (short-subunit alcohol dehydrogenase family)
MRLSESRIVVTGALSGIGKALVERLLNEGAIVVGIDREDSQFVTDRFSSIIADLSRQDQVRSS